MLDLAKVVHEAIGIQSPRMFIVVFALFGTVLFAGIGWLVDKGYRVQMAQDHQSGGHSFFQHNAPGAVGVQGNNNNVVVNPPVINAVSIRTALTYRVQSDLPEMNTWQDHTRERSAYFLDNQGQRFRLRTTGSGGTQRVGPTTAIRSETFTAEGDSGLLGQRDDVLRRMTTLLLPLQIPGPSGAYYLAVTNASINLVVNDHQETLSGPGEAQVAPGKMLSVSLRQ